MAWQAFRQYGRSFGTGFVIGLPIYITFTDLGFCVARVDGISMQPSLNPTTKESDIVLLNQWTARDAFNVKRGNVVSLISPSDPNVKLIKRVIGLEGDVIKTIGFKKQYVSIPKGHCWVEGDHRGKSYDSNKFGPISLGLVNGIATHIVWPPKRWMKIETSIDKDRMPLRRSFNQCTFSDMLKSPKEPAELSDGGSSDSKNSQAHQKTETEDVINMKNELLADNTFRGRSIATLSGEGKDLRNSSNSSTITKNDMPKLNKDLKHSLGKRMESSSSLGYNKEMVGHSTEHSGNYSNDSGNFILSENKANYIDEIIERGSEIEQCSEDFPNAKNSDYSLVGNETESSSAKTDVAEINCNRVDITEIDSGVFVKMDTDGVS